MTLTSVVLPVPGGPYNMRLGIKESDAFSKSARRVPDPGPIMAGARGKTNILVFQFNVMIVKEQNFKAFEMNIWCWENHGWVVWTKIQ